MWVSTDDLRQSGSTSFQQESNLDSKSPTYISLNRSPDSNITNAMEGMTETMDSKSFGGICPVKDGKKYKLQQPFRTTQLIFAGSKAILDKNDIAKVQRGDTDEIISEPIEKQPFRTAPLLGPSLRSINDVKANFNDESNFESAVPPLFEATEVEEALEKQPFRTLSIIHPEPRALKDIKTKLQKKIKYEHAAPSLFDYVPSY
eukprot:TCALIF_07789-PA protein Name:"Protein of unknown function" AED:0.08 eAED:0.08 QI:0/0.83/0.71/0.85/0.5/0.28/7/316/202